MKRLCGAAFVLFLFAVCIISAFAEGEYSYTQKDGKITITEYNGDAEEVIIPDEIDGMPVARLGQFAFFKKPDLRKVTVPESVKIIDSHCFVDSERLETIIIPETVESLGEYAFNNTAFYNNPLNWSDGVLYLSDCLLCVDKSYEGRLVIKDGTRVIGKFAFAGCDLIDGIEIPESVTVIPFELFICEDDDIVPVYYVYEGSVADAVVTSRGFKKEYIVKNPVGWVKTDSMWYYYDNGEPVTGWLKWKNNWYYLSSDGKMKTGWLSWNGKWYYLSDSGIMKTGWLRYKDSWYYLNSGGDMKVGWLKYNEKWYYLNENTGIMKTGWLKWKNDWYYLCSGGEMKIGWAKDNGSWYYMNSSGIMQTGWVKSNGNWYYLASSGKMVTGSRVINGKMYYFNPEGRWNGKYNEKTVYVTESGKKYHYSNKCGNYNFRAISLSEAKEKGYTPCSKCS